MSRQVVLTTAEGVQLEYTLAGLGSRFLANLVDTLMQFLFALLIFLGALAVGVTVSVSKVFTIWVMALTILGIFLVFDGYYVFFETIWSGQTPGKRMCGLRVMRDDGFPLDFRAALIRNVMRIVDFLPGFYMLAACCVMWGRDHRRLGDMVAGTLVVRDNEGGDVAAPTFSWEQQAPVLLNGVPLPLQMLTAQHVELAETFLRRRTQLTPELRARMGADVASRLRSQMAVDGTGVSDEAFVEAVVTGLARRAGL